MDWSWLDSLLGIVGGVMGVHLWQFYRNRMEFPYRWQCPDCVFKIRTSSKDGFEEVRDDHIRSFHAGTD